MSPATNTFASQIAALDESKTLGVLADARERESIVAYYATDCPADDMVHELEDGRCRKCSYSQRDPSAFISRFKAKYTAEIEKKLADEAVHMFEKIRSHKAADAPLPPEPEKDTQPPHGLNLTNFENFATSEVFGKTENRFRAMGLLLELVRRFKQFVDAEMLVEKQALANSRDADAPRIKRAVLRLTALLINKHPSLQAQVTECINKEIANYASVAALVASGFSLYFNDFTDQMQVAEKTMYEKETMDIHDEKIFEDEERNEDDTSEPQD